VFGKLRESMKTHLCTFSDESMSRAADLCIKSAEAHGVEAEWGEWTPQAVSSRDNGTLRQLIESGARGCGYWSWKPFIIADAMMLAYENDVIVYADAGVEFINNVNYIIDRMDQDIFLFGNNWEHAHWCKADTAAQVWANTDGPVDTLDLDWFRFGKQCQASVIFFRVSDYSRKFVAEWLKWCLFEGGHLIDDSPSRAPNHPEFQENRHDQAILTTMAYREGIKLHAWPAVYNRFLGQEFVYSREGYPESDNYPALFHHHRFRNLDFESLESYRARTLRGFCEDHA
jgi:hypothetical protein